MSDDQPSFLYRTRDRFRQSVEEKQLLETGVSVLARPLTPEEAIGTPGRRDYPILAGKERVVESTVLGSKGHAFTDSPREFIGTLADILDLTLDSNQNRAIYVSTLNAFLRAHGKADGTVHCKDEDPEECAREIAATLQERYGHAHVGLIGLNPAIAERLVDTFGSDHVRILDLNPLNIGQQRFGVEVWDGNHQTEQLVDVSDVVILTGTTLVNDTFDSIWSMIQSRGKQGLVYGVTVAGVSALTGLPRICPCGRNE